ncbi:hypothetical protein [Natrinema salaciae]|uniref:Uncharacterized protein n=1 Tax=Natrinema salaciae TaxID=1186196 RepID=A0A1H9ERK5_9EURY|nr:hypothetical protein [Natrinema salaciae]SEQ28331.1 hypothetical protein SAMN04489841_1365 [Natrinema salaciae]
MSTTKTPFDSIRDDNEIREGAEELAKRDDRVGALARITLAVADGEDPDPEDCEEAGLETLPKLTGGNR